MSTLRNFLLSTRRAIPYNAIPYNAIPRRATSAQGMPLFKVPQPYRHWLFDAGSLTKRLQDISHQQFQVSVLQQYQGRATLEEQRALSLPSRTSPFIREVELLCHGEPWVFARTVIPLTTLTGAAKTLTQLGTKPLGAALFNSADVSRGAICVKQIHSSQLPTSQPIEPQWLWGRHSVFYINQAPLLVNEIFLPNSALYST
ncbi:MAG: chorismate--pyruvate lyase [Moraxellaceae bacterium]|nr:MAG: chorismate--pyruvate lyase [Moraxellaceae bacterium]